MRSSIIGTVGCRKSCISFLEGAQWAAICRKSWPQVPLRTSFTKEFWPAGTYRIAKNSSAQVQPSDLAFPYQLIIHSKSTAVDHMSGKLSLGATTLLLVQGSST